MNATCHSDSIRCLVRHGSAGLSRLLLSWGLLMSSCADAADSIKVAVLTGLSGRNAVYGEGQLSAFRAATDFVNARGGVLGRKFEIVGIDNNDNAQESLVTLKRAIDSDIRYVASTLSSAVHALNEAVIKHNDRYPDKSVLLLDFNALDPALTESKCSFWHFRFEPHSDMQLAALTKYMAALPAIQSVYLINQDYAYGHGVSSGSRKQLLARRPDIRIVGDELIPLAKVADFAPYVAKIRASGADSVLTGNWGSDLTLLLKASSQANLPVRYYTLLAAGFGSASAIAAAGSNRVETVYSWHLNAANAEWQKRLLEYRSKYNTNVDLAYLPAFRTMQMLSLAMARASSTDPMQVAYALEDLRLQGPGGEAWMRAEDHQLVAPIYIMSFAKAGTAGVRNDTEDTGFGWKTESMIDGKENIPPVKCRMERPGRSLPAK